jgi:hypothetical protein
MFLQPNAETVTISPPTDVSRISLEILLRVYTLQRNHH